MAETLGSLVDKLCIVNLKMWHVQEINYDKKKLKSMSKEEILAFLNKATSLNIQRNQLIDEIDSFFEKALKTPGMKLTDPKNKVYK